jgi:hypothetical protein
MKLGEACMWIVLIIIFIFVMLLLMSNGGVPVSQILHGV